MALLPGVFIPEDAEENPFAPLAEGWKLAEIIRSELKTTKDKHGKYIALSFKVAESPEGSDVGRLLYANLNIVNKSDVAVRIARSDLKKICIAVGHESELEDTQDLHNIVMAVKVSIKPETSQWPAKNELKDYKPADYYDGDITSEDNPL